LAHRATNIPEAGGVPDFSEREQLSTTNHQPPTTNLRIPLIPERGNYKPSGTEMTQEFSQYPLLPEHRKYVQGKILGN
jgi:hypothetical protein